MPPVGIETGEMFDSKHVDNTHEHVLRTFCQLENLCEYIWDGDRFGRWAAVGSFAS